MPLSNAVKPSSRANWLTVDDDCGLMNTEVKGGSAASEGGTEVPHSKVSVIGSGICVADQTYQRGLTHLMCYI